MDVIELVKQRKQLETELKTVITLKLTDFESTTGIFIKHISVDLDNIEFFGKKESVYILSNVRCELAI